jgi:nucleoside-diphosphate-sugar epimerase
VDVTDVAKAHIEALVRPAANGGRFILASRMATYTDIADILKRDLGLECSLDKQQPSFYSIEAKNCEEVLGIKEWILFEKTMCDTVQQVQASAL